MTDKKKIKDEDLSLEQLIEKLKENLLIEGTKKADEKDLGIIMRHWLDEDKRH